MPDLRSEGDRGVRRSLELCATRPGEPGDGPSPYRAVHARFDPRIGHRRACPARHHDPAALPWLVATASDGLPHGQCRTDVTVQGDGSLVRPLDRIMSYNSFGHMFRVTTFGESHGPAI